MKKRETKKLLYLVFNLKSTFIPITSKDNLRYEKKFSILIFEKLAQVTISLGADTLLSYQIRDQFISESENGKDLNDVLQIRVAAITYFSEKISYSNAHYSFLIANVIEYINANLAKKISIETITTQFNFSNSHLRKLFKKETGYSIQKYITKQKIDEAKLMLEMNKNVSEIAFALSFSNTAHFSRVFKSEVGISPKQYQMKTYNSKKRHTISLSKLFVCLFLYELTHNSFIL